jgi:hypothetical protein
MPKTAYLTLKSCHLFNQFFLLNFVSALNFALLFWTQELVEFLLGILNISLCSTSAVSAKIILLDAHQLKIFVYILRNILKKLFNTGGGDIFRTRPDRP